MGLPAAFVERMRKMLGEESEAFLESLQQEKYQALHLNPLKAGEEDLFAKTSFHLTPVPWGVNGFYYEKEDQPGKHPFHEAGVYYIQEPSAMAPAELLEACPGEKVLDLCAAPGGKSTQLAAAMKGQGILVCNEIHPARAKILSENIERLGIRNAVVMNESPQKLAEEFPGYFDKILVDAPCSGEGMFRKNEEAAQEWSPENVRMCALRQDEILDCAARMLKGGGRLAYSTCTFAPQEDEGTVARFLIRHPDFKVMDSDSLSCEKFSYGNFSSGKWEWAVDADGEPLMPVMEGELGTRAAALESDAGSREAMFRIWPHKQKGEGHFMAVLYRDGRDSGSFSRGGFQKGLPPRECGDFFSFEKETLNRSVEEIFGQGIYVKFGDQLYFCPPGLPSLKGLKVLRPGLHLGTRKKNRFEPSHALALALNPEMVRRCISLDPDGKKIEDYLDGLTFPAQGQKGWYLIATDGYSIGWGKLAGGIMKNHYPKGLRK